jgi:hypothetical protein
MGIENIKGSDHATYGNDTITGNAYNNTILGMNGR